MTLRLRRGLFVLFTVLFVVIGASIVLYGLGWRINPTNFKIQKTGAIAIKTNPRGVKIKLDGEEFRDKSNIIQDHTLISNLLPKTYEVSIEKFGYRSFQKNLAVQPSLVTTLNVFLLPKQFNTKSIIQRVRGNLIFDISADYNKIITENSANGSFYLYNLKNTQTALNIDVLADSMETSPVKSISKITKAVFLPFDSSRLLIETNSGLKILDTVQLKIDDITDTKVLSWDLKNSSVYFIVPKKEGGVSILSYNLIFKNQNNILDIASTTVKLPIKTLKASASGNQIAFLDSSGGLFRFDGNMQKLEKITHLAKFFEFAPNSKAIAFLDTDGTINIEYITDWDSAFRKKTGDISQFDLPNKEKFTKISWYLDSLRIFVFEKDSVKIMETDDRPPLNIYDIESGFEDFFYDAKATSAYLIKQGELQKIDFK